MSDNAKMVFADNLKMYLNAKGLSQIDLANYMQCSSSTVSDWCNGKKYPRVDKMQRMADWLGIQMSDLTSVHDKLEDADMAFYNRYKQLTEDEKEDMFLVDIWLNSPEGMDYKVSLKCLTGDALNELVKGLEEEYEGFDVSEETYYYLDNSGHGTFGAPYDMKDAYEDMAAIKEIIKKLAEVFKKVRGY